MVIPPALIAATPVAIEAELETLPVVVEAAVQSAPVAVEAGPATEGEAPVAEPQA